MSSQSFKADNGSGVGRTMHGVSWMHPVAISTDAVVSVFHFISDASNVWFLFRSWNSAFTDAFAAVLLSSRTLEECDAFIQLFYPSQSFSGEFTNMNMCKIPLTNIHSYTRGLSSSSTLRNIFQCYGEELCKCPDEATIIRKELPDCHSSVRRGMRHQPGSPDVEWVVL